MFISPTNSKRFNLYHLEQKQIYIQDFYGSCTYHNLVTHEKIHNDKGKFYLCSKSLIFESDQKNTPLMKFRFQSLKEIPIFTNECMKFVITRITTIKASPNMPPQPFRIFQDLKQQIQVWPSYEKMRKLEEWINFLHLNARQKNNFDMQDKIYHMIIEKFNKKSFNMSLIQSVSEKPVLSQNNILARRVLPLTHIYGYIYITSQSVYFEPFHKISSASVDRLQICKINKLFKRRYQLRNIGLQIELSAQSSTSKYSLTNSLSFYFTFETENHRNTIFNILSKRVSSSCIKIETLEKITFMWQMKQITNYEYLIYLNQAGNRSISDLSQYPVFPWVLSNYDQETIDLEDQKSYRDLSKPIGALNEARLLQFIERYQNMDPPKFMYGSHYSTPGYVIGYLLRKKPEYMLKLQSGRFDKPDRLFKSIKDDWYNIYENPTSLKQLIPQFYQDDPLFLKNYQNLDLGVRQNKKRVGDVKLPPWSEGSADKFLSIMRKALQSEYVSNNLHKWIDLIFGYKQRGQQAIKANNLFFHLTYEGMVDIDTISDPIQKIALKDQINQFGQCPKQIFIIPHPPRYSTTIQRPIDFNDYEDKLGDQKTEEKQQKYENSDNSQSEKIEQKEEYHVPSIKPLSQKKMQASSLYSNGYPKVKTALGMGDQKDMKMHEIPRAHKSQITHMIHLQSKQNSLLTIGQDGFLKIYDIAQKSCIKSFKICQFVLSCIAMIKNEQIFAIGSWDNNIYLFNITYGSRSKPFPAHDNSINDMVYLSKRKRLITGSWDCSIKMFRYVGNILDSQQQLWDHDNQISCVASNEDENILTFGDIEGNVICLNIDEKQQIFSININSQRIGKMHFIQNNIIAVAESEMRIIDLTGSLLCSYFIDKNNGMITDFAVDGQHLFITTTNKQMALFDILQQKKIGNYFNNFTQFPKDKLPDEKQLTCVAIGNDGLFVAVGSGNGNIYIIKS